MAPYYRNYQLAWEADPEEQERFRRLLFGGLGLLLLISIALTFIHIPLPKLSAEEAVPPRLARLMVPEKPKPPPVIPPKPEVKPEPKPAETPKPVDTRKKMEQSAQMRAIKDQLADLREQVDVTPLQARNLTGTVGAESKSERSLITSKVGSGSSAALRGWLPPSPSPKSSAADRAARRRAARRRSSWSLTRIRAPSTPCTAVRCGKIRSCRASW